MRDRFQFFPKYNFFNFFKPQGFVSFGFKHYEKKVVSYVPSRRNISVFYKALGNSLILRVLADLSPEAKLAFNPLEKDFVSSIYNLTAPVVDFENLSGYNSLLCFNIRSEEAVSAIFVHGVSSTLLYSHS
jgi:hypothetical protein